jgi:hypothetical protein
MNFMHAKLTQKPLDQIGTEESARCALCKFFFVAKLFHRLNITRFLFLHISAINPTHFNTIINLSNHTVTIGCLRLLPITGTATRRMATQIIMFLCTMTDTVLLICIVRTQEMVNK